LFNASRSMKRKKNKVLEIDIQCNICHVKNTNDLKHIERHNSGDMHLRFMKLNLKRAILEFWNFQ
jgi:hypothetical protein